MKKLSIILIALVAVLSIIKIADATVWKGVPVDSNTPTTYLFELPVNVSSTLNVSTSLTVAGLGGSGTPCVDIANAAGLFATTTCGSGGGIASTTPWTLQNFVVASGTGIATINATSGTYYPYSNPLNFVTSTGLASYNVTSANSYISVSTSTTAATLTFVTSSFGSNAFTSTAIPTNYISTLNGGSGAQTYNLYAGTGLSISTGTASTTLSLTIPVSTANGGTGTTTAIGTAAFKASTDFLASSTVYGSSNVSTSSANTWSTTQTFTGATVNGTLTLGSTTNALLITSSGGVVSGYAATSCAAGTAYTGLSATGTPTCTTFATSTASSAVTSIVAGTGINISGATGAVTINASSSLASTSVTFFIGSPTTTATAGPSYRGYFHIPTKALITQADCSEQASATSTITEWYNTTNGSSGLQQVILPSIACGTGTAGATSTATFTTSTIPSGAYLWYVVSSTAGTPTLTVVNNWFMKQ